MSATVSHRTLITQARREIRALKRPNGVRSDSWRSVQDLLVAIAGYLPDPFPSQRTLAAKLHLRQRTVCDQIQRAIAWGLLTTTPRPSEGGRLAGVDYHLVCLPMDLRAAITRGAYQRRFPLRREISYSVGDLNAPSSRRVLPAGLRPADQTAEVIPMPNRWNENDEWTSPAIGEDPAAPVPGAATVRVDPAVYLARQFDSKWADAARSTPALRVSRASSRGMAIGYLRKVMLPQVSAEHAVAYMDAFIEAAAAGDVVVKEGQFAFERFTGWWGREDVEDPAERQATSIRAREAIARAREIWAEQDRQKGLTNG